MTRTIDNSDSPLDCDCRRQRGPYVERTVAAGFAFVTGLVGRSQDRPTADADELCRGCSAHHAPNGGVGAAAAGLSMRRPWWWLRRPWSRLDVGRSWTPTGGSSPSVGELPAFIRGNLGSDFFDPSYTEPRVTDDDPSVRHLRGRASQCLRCEPVCHGGRCTRCNHRHRHARQGGGREGVSRQAALLALRGAQFPNTAVLRRHAHCTLRFRWTRARLALGSARRTLIASPRARRSSLPAGSVPSFRDRWISWW